MTRVLQPSSSGGGRYPSRSPPHHPPPVYSPARTCFHAPSIARGLHATPDCRDDLADPAGGARPDGGRGPTACPAPVARGPGHCAGGSGDPAGPDPAAGDPEARRRCRLPPDPAGHGGRAGALRLRHRHGRGAHRPVPGGGRRRPPAGGAQDRGPGRSRGRGHPHRHRPGPAGGGADHPRRGRPRAGRGGPGGGGNAGHRCPEGPAHRSRLRAPPDDQQPQPQGPGRGGCHHRPRPVPVRPADPGGRPHPQCGGLCDPRHRGPDLHRQ